MRSRSGSPPSLCRLVVRSHPCRISPVLSQAALPASPLKLQGNIKLLRQGYGFIGLVRLLYFPSDSKIRSLGRFSEHVELHRVLRHLAESGAHVIFSVANTDAARELVATWEGERVDNVPPLNCEVCAGFDVSVSFHVW